MIIPAKGRILIKKIERKDIQAESGIFMPGQTLQEESLFYGEVVGLAKEASNEFGSFPYSIGDRVFYSRYSATKVVDDKGNDYLIVSDLDVMAHDTGTVTK